MSGGEATFTHRSQAGQQLAVRLASMALDGQAVYALPRDGVSVAVEISRGLNAPLDLAMVCKIGAPFNPEREPLTFPPERDASAVRELASFEGGEDGEEASYDGADHRAAAAG